MNAPTLPTWRSLLFVPANNRRFLEKAHTRGADAVIVDLEDSVPFGEKKTARDHLPVVVHQVTQSGADMLVRINHPLRMAVRDLEAAVIAGVRGLVVPKVESAAALQALADVVTELEIERSLVPGSVVMLVQIESPEALPKLDDIASVSRVVGLTLGPEDFCAEVGMEPNADTLLVPSQAIVFAANRSGVTPYGFVDSIADYSDQERFAETIKRARQLGFRGALAVHPSQVTIMNEGFMPSAEEIQKAREIVENSRAHEQKGEAVFSLDGKMIDKPVVERAARLLNQVKERV
ncbi:HpcH/HpaI aldolase/citrate lyase family protein [Marinobacter litoralis]|uniref:HpcH/HpaI aldolase/citrate lyase family protein n=1 Tax=Marinobacter litoralis TaxID=187981 RepID=UPI0018EE2406|nr:CoA ester lyase [Marinobacter litoralis]MBJ6136094.1 CoA ester lyase [Marinobacter litoralis]